LVLDQDEHSGQEVPYQRLSPEAHRQAGDTGTGDQRGQIDVELAQTQQRGHGQDERGGQAFQHGGDGLYPLGTAHLALLDSIDGLGRSSAEVQFARALQLLFGLGLALAHQSGHSPFDHLVNDLFDDPGHQQDEDDPQGPLHHPADDLGQPLVLGVVEDQLAEESRIGTAGVGDGLRGYPESHRLSVPARPSDESVQAVNPSGVVVEDLGQ